MAGSARAAARAAVAAISEVRLRVFMGGLLVLGMHGVAAHDTTLPIANERSTRPDLPQNVLLTTQQFFAFRRLLGMREPNRSAPFNHREFET